MSASTTITLRTAAFHVFGSGSAWACLCLANGKRTKGKFVEATDNGFVGYEWAEVTLYNKTRVEYRVGAYPGGELVFNGTWGELCARLQPAMTEAQRAEKIRAWAASVDKMPRR